MGARSVDESPSDTESFSSAQSAERSLSSLLVDYRGLRYGSLRYYADGGTVYARFAEESDPPVVFQAPTVMPKITAIIVSSDGALYILQMWPDGSAHYGAAVFATDDVGVAWVGMSAVYKLTKEK